MTKNISFLFKILDVQNFRFYYAVLSRFIRYICFKLYPRESNPHSVETLAVPRSRNLRYPWLPLICPNTVSTSTDRCFLNSANSSFLRVRLALRFSRSNRSFRSMVRFPFALVHCFLSRQYLHDSHSYFSIRTGYPEPVFSLRVSL